MIMPFGKHAGKQLSDIPLAYLGWYTSVEAPDPKVLAAILEELKRRETGSNQDAPRESSRSEVTIEDALEVITAGRRALATKHHPDAGGDLARMQGVNACADWLEAQVRKALCK